LGRDTSFCAGNTVTLRFTPQQNTSVNWSTGANTNNINVNTGGTYWVEISRDICKQRDSVNIQVLPLPVVTSPFRYNICDQAATTVNVQGIFDNIHWNDGQSGSSIQIDKAGRFPFRISRGVCIVDTAVFINLVPIPDPALDEVAELCQGDRLTLSAPAFTGNILWSNGENGKIINIRNGGKYKLTLSQSGCSRADSINVTLINCSGDVLHFPNIFSPVKTLIENQFFKAIVDENFEITSFDLRIYDRNGSQVFSTYDINDQWEGKMNNIDLLSGVYTYLCKVSATGKKNVQDKIITGAVTLVR
jgi:hypothetical protein